MSIIRATSQCLRRLSNLEVNPYAPRTWPNLRGYSRIALESPPQPALGEFKGSRLIEPRATYATALHTTATPHYTGVKILTDPTARERAAAENVIALAMRTNHFLMMTINHDPVFAHPFARCFLTAALLEGTVYVAEDAGNIVAVSIWFGPGTEFLHSELQCEQALEPMLACFDKGLQVWWDTFLKDYHDMMEEALGPGVLLNSWHFQLAATHPSYHRSGLTRRLAEFGITHAQTSGCAVTGEPCGGEIAPMLPLLTGMGFETKGHRIFRGPEGAGEGQLWSMILKALDDQGEAHLSAALRGANIGSG